MIIVNGNTLEEESISGRILKGFLTLQNQSS